MATKTWPGIEGLETERLGFGCRDHFPDIDPHPLVQHLELIHKRDVDGSIRVLKDLAGLGDVGAGHAHHLGHDLTIKRRRQLEALVGSSPPTTFGIFGAEKSGLPGSSRSGLYARKKSSPALRPVASRMGKTTWRVVPGYVVLSRMTSCPGRSRAAIDRVDSIT